MRSVLILIVLVLVAFCATQASAQPRERNVTVLILHQDDSCTGSRWLATGLIEEPSSTRCIPGEPGNRAANASFIFTCTTTTDTTTMRLALYNDSRACDNSPLVDYSSTGSPHTCAPISVTVEGQKFAISGHVECDVDVAAVSAGTSLASLHSAAKKLVSAPVQAAPAKQRSIMSRLFQ